MQLLRAMGKWDLTALGVNQIIGSGIFVLPASVALLVGAAASPVVWVTAAAINLLIVLCLAEAGSRFRNAGGPYLYAREAFGGFVGFEVAWMIWLTRVAAQAALANAFALYFAYFVPSAAEGPPRLAVVSALILFLAGINFVGVRHGSRTVNLLTVLKLAPLAVFVVVGVFFMDWSRFQGLLQPRWEGFGQSILLLMFAFGGYEVVTLPAGEARSPRRDVPKALVLAILIAGGVYLSVQVVAVGLLPDLGATQTPLADAAELVVGSGGGVLIALAGLVAIGGANAGTMLAGPRVTYAMGDRGELPSFFRHVHPRYRTPDYSIAVYTAVALGLAVSGTFVQLAAVSALARLVFYSVSCLAVPRLRRVRQMRGAWELPAGPLIPITALAGSLAIIAGADRVSLMAGGTALAVGAVLFTIERRRRRRHPLG